MKNNRKTMALKAESETSESAAGGTMKNLEEWKGKAKNEPLTEI